MAETNFHSPGHLLCCGVSFDDLPLAHAAWAGNCMARGQTAEAAHWASAAKELLGTIMFSASAGGTRRGHIEVRYTGDRPNAKEIGFMIEAMQIQRDGLLKYEQLKAERPSAVEVPHAT